MTHAPDLVTCRDLPDAERPSAVNEQAIFRALADPTRRHILAMLADEEMTVSAIAGRFDMTRAAVKKHLVVLEQGELISVTRRGRERINRLRPDALKPAVDWLRYFERFWDDRLTALEQAIDAAADDR